MFTNKILLRVAGPVLIAALATPVHAGQPRTFHAGETLNLADLPERGGLRRRIEGLKSAAAKDRAVQWLRSFTFTEHDLDYLHSDTEGGIYYADSALPEAAPTALTDAISSQQAQATQITASEVFTLHSRPGAANVVYLDFTGHVLTGTAWNDTYATLTAVPYDLDGQPTTFNVAEVANIASIWRRVAEDYAPFDIDVTTQEPASFGARTARVLITSDSDANGNAMPAQGAGGVAYVNPFGMSVFPYYSPALVYFNRLGGGQADYVAEAASHELGHNLGLSHDGTSSLTYFGGMGSGAISWGPIMGTGYYRNVSQWSKGEYVDANNHEDDVAMIAGKLTRRPDDHANTRSGATALVIDAAGNVASTTPETDPTNTNPANKGVISSSTDVDYFTFTTTGGAVTLSGLPLRESSNTRGGNLDIKLSLYDAAGTLLTSSDPQNDTDATISLNLSAGQYFLSVEGVGNAITPYSNYGSLGQYFLSGTIPVFVSDTIPDTFTFTPLLDVALSAFVESSVVSIGGINTAAPVSVSGGDYRINGGPYGSAGSSVNNGDTVQVRHTSAATSLSAVTTTLTIGGVSGSFTSTTALADTTPNDFAFSAVTGVPYATLVESEVVTISGINAPVAVTVSGGEYRINGGAYGSAAGVLRNGDSVQLRHTSSGVASGSVTTTVVAGSMSRSFKSTTWDITPNAFAFPAVTGVPFATPVESNVVTIAGINVPAPVTVTGGEYRINGGAYGSAATTVSNGDTLQLRHTSAGVSNGGVSTTVVVGDMTRKFWSTTWDITPNAFVFTAVTGVPYVTPVESNVVTIAGINAPAAVTVTGGEYRINGGAYGSAVGSVSNGDTLQLRHTSAGVSNGGVSTTVVVGSMSRSFRSTTWDITPNTFAFPAVTGVPFTTPVESNVVTISGINVPAPVTVTGGEYRINGGAYGSAAGTVSNGDTLQLRHTSAGVSNGGVSTTVVVGDMTRKFWSTTWDITPNAFVFPAVTGVPFATPVESNVVTISGINVPAPVTVTGGEYRINGGAYGSAAGTVSNGDTLQLRHTSASVSNGGVSTTVVVGDMTRKFWSTTWDITPTAFSFTTLTGVSPSTSMLSNPVTIGGITGPAPVSVVNGEYSLNGGAFTSAAGTLANGDVVVLRHTASALAKATVTTTLIIGGVSGTFKTTTAP